MSSHYIYVQCRKCGKSESLYTGDTYSEDFDDADWEGSFLTVPMCLACKEAEHVEATTDIQANTKPSAS